MTTVLLITDTERVQRVFASLEAEGLLQLRTAAALTQGDLEIAASAPDFTFVQSRISGFSGVIVLRHLKKALPKRAKLMLLVGDAEDAAQARQDALPFLDLTMDDETLAGAIREVVSGVGPAVRKKSAARQPGTAGKGVDAKVKAVAPVSPSVVVGEPEKKKAAVEQEPPAGLPALEAEEPAVEQAPAAGSMGLEKEEPAAQEPADEPPAQEADELVVEEQPGTATAKGGSFEEIMRRAASKSGSGASDPLDVEDRVYLRRAPPEAAEGPELPLAPDLEDMTAPLPDEFLRGEPLAEAMQRAQKKKHPRWMLPLALALVFIPLAVYMAGRQTAPPEPLVAPNSVSRPDLRASEPPAPEQIAKPEAKPVAKPEAKPVVKPGLKTLPPFVVGAKLDADYGKTHPGWQRYVGMKAEYKLFREADLYRAIQVIALGGQTISEQLLKKMLLEFGGIDSYQVRSKEKKGDYLVEEGVANGGVAVTLYRQKDDLRIKGLVVYYR